MVLRTHSSGHRLLLGRQVSAPKTTHRVIPHPGRTKSLSLCLPSAQTTHHPHLLLCGLMDLFPSLLLFVCLLFVLLWEDIVNPGQVMLGENQVQEPSNNDKAQDLGWEEGQKG